MKLNKKTTILILGCLTIIALGLRIYKLGRSNFIEDENLMVKAAAYLYFSHEKIVPVRSFRSRLWALLLDNETVPNLFTQVYLWDFVKSTPSQIHHSRAWPQLYLMSLTYRIFGIKEWSSRLISVIAGSLLIPAGYYLARSLKRPKTLSLVYAAGLALAFPLIDFSRNARMYSLFGLLFLLAINPRIWKKPILGLLSLILAYWLHLLTLLIPTAVAVEALIKKRRKRLVWLISGLILLFTISRLLRVDIFQSYFWQLKIRPDWKYFVMLLAFPWPWWLNATIIISRFRSIFTDRNLSWLMILVLTYLVFLIFLGKMPAGGAYVYPLVPIILLFVVDCLKNQRWLLIILMVAIFARFLLGFNYLYQGRNGQAKIPQAYQIIINQLKPGEQILGIQIRDYYLQDLAPDTLITNLPEKQSLELTEFVKLTNQAAGGFMVWEVEKIAHLKPEVVSYIKKNFKHLAGEKIDNNLVEIYYWPK